MIDQSKEVIKENPDVLMKDIMKQTDLMLRLAQDRNVNLPPNIARELAFLSTRLTQLNKQISGFESEKKDLRSLVSISHIINSSLNLSEVLRIVMDMIINITSI